MIACLLAQKFRDFDFQFAQPPIALNQFLADVFVFAQFYKFAYRLAQSLDWQRHIVLHQFCAANSQFRPRALLALVGRASPRAEASAITLTSLADFFTRNFHILKKFIRLA